MWRFNKKTIGLFVVSAIIFFIVIKSCGGSSEKEFIYEKVAKTVVLKTINATGSLAVADAIILVSKSTGIIENVNAVSNTKVSNGQLLIKLDTTSIDQRVLKAASILESVQLEIESSKRELEGKKNLFKDNLISKRAMEQAEIQHSSVLSRYKQVKIDYEIAVQERNLAHIYSPMDGIVITNYKWPNDQVYPSNPLILIAPSLAKMVLTISIDESDMGIAKVGQVVQFIVSAYPDRKFFGTINWIDINPVNNGGIVTYSATVICGNDELLLKPGMTATATIVVEEKKNIIAVSNQAFMVNPENNKEVDNYQYLWKKVTTVSGKSYKKIPVKIGLIGDLYTEITEGVNEGDQIMIIVKESK